VSEKKFHRELDVLRSYNGVAAVASEIVAARFPELRMVFIHPSSRRRVGFQFQFDDWDQQPPSLALFDPETNSTLVWEKWPQGGWHAGNPHPTTGKPFLCLPGIREYHIHPSHLNDYWDNYKAKGCYTLGFIVDRVRQRFKYTNG